MNDIFPIKKSPACLLKWGWSSVLLNEGASASCHRTQPYKIDPDNFDQFHNLPEKIRDRELMLDGQWPGNGCEYCRNVEMEGGLSDRLMQLKIQKDPGLTAPELFQNPSATSVTPTMLEVYFKNTCNMKCVYCGPKLSSKWAEELRKFDSTFINENNKNPHYDSMVSDLWNYLKQNQRYLRLRRFHILGGEPFLMDELDQSLDFWEQHPNSELIFSIITNLNIPNQRIVKYIERFQKLMDENKIWKFQITGSLDAWGPQQEYTRFGLDLSLWQKNFESLLNLESAIISINSAMSALTIKQMPELIERINGWNQQRRDPILHSFETTGTKDDLFMFGGEYFKLDFQRILSLMPEDNEIQISQKQQMAGIADLLGKKEIDLKKIEGLKNYLNMLDKRRGTNWRTTFEWLDKDF